MAQFKHRTVKDTHACTNTHMPVSEEGPCDWDWPEIPSPHGGRYGNAVSTHEDTLPGTYNARTHTHTQQSVIFCSLTESPVFWQILYVVCSCELCFQDTEKYTRMSQVFILCLHCYVNSEIKKILDGSVNTVQISVVSIQPAITYGHRFKTYSDQFHQVQLLKQVIVTSCGVLN